MKYLSVCSGIEAATCAWHPLGWEPFAFSEIEAFPSSVLAHHYPTVPNLGDMTKFKEWPDATLDLLVGGTPCQSFSVAGLRKGLADPRGNLMLTYLAIADRYRPAWLVWENVPGVLSSNGGRDFGALLGGLAKLGYGFAYRVLDAQYFGVPQRRRRVFVVGRLGDWRRAAAVLFERHSLQGHPAPSRKAGEGTTGAIRASAGQRGGIQEQDGGSGLIPEVANPLTARMHKGINTTCDEGQTMIAHSLRAEGFDASEDGTGRGTPLVPVVSPTLLAQGNKTGGDRPPGTTVDTCESLIPVADTTKLHNTASNNAGKVFEERSTCLDANSPPPALLTAMQVRRLTPRECERLQGFPDDYTLIPVRGKPAADGPRYKALGNSMAVPVMAWIGERISLVDGVAL